MQSPKNALSAAGRFLWSLIAPKTPRGKVRRAFAFIIVLFIAASSIAEPRGWNAAAGFVNAQLDAVHAPFKIRVATLNVPYRLGLDLQGGTHLVYTADVSGIHDSDRAEAIDGVRDVIERRVNAFGVSEPVIQTNKSGDTWRVIVDLAGVKDIGEAIKQIGETPVLEFKEQSNEPARTLTPDEQKDLDAFNTAADKKGKEVLAKALKPGADFAALAKEFSDDAATKDAGGDLGFLKEGDASMYAPLVQLAAKLAVGQVLNSPAKLDDGIHIVKLTEKKPSADTEVSASHILICYKGAQKCTQTRTREEAKALADKLKAQATPQNFATLAKANSDDPGSGAKGGDLGFFTKTAMVKPFADAAYAATDGSIVGPIETDFGYHIIYRTASRTKEEYRLSHILIDTKTATDYVPISPWKNTALSGKELKRAALQFHPQTNEPQVGIEFNEAGAKLFADITQRNVGKPVAIFLDGAAISTPVVNEAITGGQAVISGKFSIAEAKLLARRLNAGALPVPISLETQQTVGASLGQDSLQASLKAGLLGFLIVALFMLFYYRLPGLIALVALSLYAAINLTLYKLIPVTLSLSGIAGLILSIGVAVDANVLIFERMKEELTAGRPLASAIDEGFRRAWLSIRDSNFTSLISCAILFYTSSSLIRGFALTLAIGVLVSMFSAITISRTLLRLVAGWKPLKSTWLYLPGLHKAVAPADDQA